MEGGGKDRGSELYLLIILFVSFLQCGIFQHFFILQRQTIV